MKRAFLLFVGVMAIGVASANAAVPTIQVLTRKQHHLRSGNEPEWEEFANKKPEGTKLELRFAAKANPAEQTLFIQQSNLKFEWPVRLNGTNLGKLFLMEAPLLWTLRVPPGTLREGPNVLSIMPPKENDDIIIGPIRLDPRPRDQALGESTLVVQVREDGRLIPCRITITGADGVLAAFTASAPERLAIRPGVIYTGTGQAEAQLPAGKYSIFASRGPEYSLASKAVKLRRGGRIDLSLNIKREVPTPGLVSCDTHIHTWTYSRHGDCTLDERMLTIAGEALELPIATDHNLVIDYAACARSNHVNQYFTSVVGDEVTTAKGHFNAFPIIAGSAPPDFKIENWPALMDAIRTTPGVQVIVLNHPADTHNGFCPFAATNFNPVTGENLRGFEFSFDCIEVVNSGALRSDLMETFRDWFALLNYGYRVTGVGASDSHDVSRFIVGQGRTYIRCDDHDPGAIDVNEACRNLRAGRALISLGLLVNIRVNDRFGVGDLATNLAPLINVAVDVLGPSWARADHVQLVANGLKVREQRVVPSANVEKAHLNWSIPRPLHDVYLVAIVTGPGVLSPHWEIPRPYQPNSTKWTPRVLGATNPVWLDADGDGRFTSARAYAKQIIERTGTDPGALRAALSNFDQAV
ncbi:MAG TPA: CehA/McbA family metallohydrolase, partial [Verrucomicrobiae bacterium]|nr:CehA/McbA family metallohydrolase [Verrucomicrobiae bacterium]